MTLDDSTDTSKRPSPKKKPTLQQQAVWLRGDLRLLLRYRAAQHQNLGAPIETIVRIIAEVLGAAPPGTYWVTSSRHRPRRKPWPGLDAVSLKDELRICGIEAPNAAIPHKTRPLETLRECLGFELKLTTDERDGLGITTMDAIDETLAARRERKALSRKQRDSERFREKRATYGSRADYLAAAAAKRAERKASGISRTTEWRHRQKVKQSPRHTPLTIGTAEGLVSPAECAANGAAVLTLTADAGASPTAPQRGFTGKKSAPEAPTPSILRTEPLIEVGSTSGSAQNLDFERAKKFGTKNEKMRVAEQLSFELEPPSPAVLANIEAYRDKGGPLPVDVLRLLRDKRRAHGITQGQLARQLLVARPTIANVEAGRYVLGGPPRVRLCQWLIAA